MSLLRRIEKAMDQRLRAIFAGGGEEPEAREAVELYRDALEQIAARTVAGKRGEKVFAFNLVTVELKADEPERKAVLQTLFDPGQFVEDIRATLKEDRVAVPAELTVAVRYPADAAVEMRVFCERTEKAPAAPAAVAAVVEMKPAALVAITGAPSAPEFAIDRPLVNLGREQEVVDAMGRVVRRNDLWFPEGAHEANGSVSRSHAHIRFDPASGGWRIFDDGSSLGTSLFRAGKRIEVPPHGVRGVALKAGDEVNLGQVRLRFQA